MTDTDIGAILKRQTEAILAIDEHVEAYAEATTVRLNRQDDHLASIDRKLDLVIERLDRLSDAILRGFTQTNERLRAVEQR